METDLLKLVLPDLILAVAIAALWFYDTRKRGKMPTEKRLGIEPLPAKKLAADSLRLLGILLIIGWVAGKLASVLFGDQLAGVNDVIRELSALPVYVLVAIVVVRAVLEEILFRALLVPHVGSVAAGVLFGFSHIGYGSFGEVLGATLAGLILARYYETQKNLMPPILAHVLYNTLAIVLVLSGGAP